MLTNTFPKTAFFYLFVLSLKGVFADEVKSVSVTEGDSVTLNTDVTEVQIDDHILWMFGPQDTRIADIYNQKIKLFNTSERFRDKLQMDSQNGSLIIRNIRSEHTGLYKLTIIRSRGTSYKRFNVTVWTPLPVPVISRLNASSSSSSSSSVSICSLVCSVLNVSDVTLSWYKGMSVLSSISESNISISLSLPLDVEYQDKNTYSCVINNPVRNQTTHLDITQLCHTSEENQTVLPVVLAASIFAVLVVLAGLMYFLYRKRKRMEQKGNGYEPSAHGVETAQIEGEEVQYAETGFIKQNGQRTKANKAEETIYSSIVT